MGKKNVLNKSQMFWAQALLDKSYLVYRRTSDSADYWFYRGMVEMLETLGVKVVRGKDYKHLLSEL